jgi:hypothetical protein
MVEHLLRKSEALTSNSVTISPTPPKKNPLETAME